MEEEGEGTRQAFTGDRRQKGFGDHKEADTLLEHAVVHLLLLFRLI